MADNAVLLNGVSYPFARESMLPRGAKRWGVTARPSIPTDPSIPTQEIEWQVWGPNLNSFELIPPGASVGFLGVDYGINTESRWEGINCLGPAISTVDLSATGGTAANTNSAALSGTMNATLFLYVGRGTGFAKINPSTMARVAQAVEANATVAENITDMAYTKATNGTQGIAIGMRATAYRVITAVANAGSDDTHSANSGSEICTAFLPSAADRIFGAQDATATQLARVRHNILTGSVTMAAPNWVTVGSIHNDLGNLKVNSLGLDGTFLCVGTNGGVYNVDPNFNAFRCIDPETEWDDTNCAVMGTEQWLGLVFGLRYATRFLKWGEGSSIGPEQWRGNTSPVQGRLTGVAGSDRWLYQAHYDDISGDTYLLAGRPREPNDPHPNPISWYTLAKFPSKACNFLEYFGTFNGTRTLPTLVGGYGTDIFYMSAGRRTRWIDDSSYTYATSGTTYLTEARRLPGLIKDVEAVEFESSGCDTNKTITVGVSFDGAAAVTLTAVTSNGYQRLLPVSGGVPLGATTWSGRRLKPQMVYASNSSSSSPSVVGKLRILYRGRPIQTKVYEFSVVLQHQANAVKSVAELTAQLMTEWGSGPVSLEIPDSLTSVYVRVDDVSIVDVADTNDNKTKAQGTIRVATIRATQWPVSSGE